MIVSVERMMKMMSLHLPLTSIPTLALFRDAAEQRARQGTILFYHGFGTSKETYVSILQQLAEAGFLAIGVDAVGHGERRYPDFAERFPPFEPPFMGNLQLEAAFLSLVRATVQEIPSLLDVLLERGWAHPGRIGIAGHSMGGFVTYAAAVADPRILVAAAVSGSPHWKLPWPDSPHLHLDRFFPTALLSQIAANDMQVPPDGAKELHASLAPYYTQAPERLSLIEYPDTTHALSEQEWEQAWIEVVRWFTVFFL
jgi:uncharacterized protein